MCSLMIEKVREASLLWECDESATFDQFLTRLFLRSAENIAQSSITHDETTLGYLYLLLRILFVLFAFDNSVTLRLKPSSSEARNWITKCNQPVRLLAAIPTKQKRAEGLILLAGK